MGPKFIHGLLMLMSVIKLLAHARSRVSGDQLIDKVYQIYLFLNLNKWRKYFICQPCVGQHVSRVAAEMFCGFIYVPVYPAFA
jgi:hypothetical protein